MAEAPGLAAFVLVGEVGAVAAAEAIDLIHLIAAFIASPSLEATFGLLADLVVSGLEPAERSNPAPGVSAFRSLVEGIDQAMADDPVIRTRNPWTDPA